MKYVMGKTLRILTGLMNALIMVILAALVLIIFSNVVLRYFFNSGLTWTVEVTGLLFVWLIFLGAVMAMRDYGHLGVDLLVAQLPRIGQKILFTLTYGVIVVLCALFADGLIAQMQINGMVTGSATPIPVNIMYLAGLVAAILLALIAVVQIIQFVLLDGEGPPWARPKERTATPEEPA